MGFISAMLLAIGVVAASPSHRSLPFEAVIKGGMSGVSGPTKRLITSPQAWDQFWTAHQRRGTSIPEEPPEIDFDQNAVVAVSFTCPSSGYFVHIEEVTRSASEEGVIDVTYSVDTPAGKKGAVLTVVTQPYHVVQIPKPADSAHFHRKKQPVIQMNRSGGETQVNVFALTEPGEQVVIEGSNGLEGNAWETLLERKNRRDRTEMVKVFHLKDQSTPDFSPHRFYRVRWPGVL